jgi:hypothetical protein
LSIDVGESYLFHHLTGLVLELLQQLDLLLPLVVLVVVLLLLDKEDVVPLADQWIFDFLALESHEDLVLL